jgi:hypothetical protein
VNAVAADAFMKITTREYNPICRVPSLNETFFSFAFSSNLLDFASAIILHEFPSLKPLESEAFFNLRYSGFQPLEHYGKITMHDLNDFQGTRES